MFYSVVFTKQRTKQYNNHKGEMIYIQALSQITCACIVFEYKCGMVIQKSVLGEVHSSLFICCLTQSKTPDSFLFVVMR